MPIGLLARIIVDPEAVLRNRWSHDMANAFCRARIQAELRFWEKRRDAGLRYF